MKRQTKFLMATGCFVASCLVCLVCFSQDLNQRVSEGRKALEEKQNQKAYDIFSKLLREHPEDEAVNFYLGKAAYGIGKLSHAALAYERVLMLNPKNDVARAQLARTYMAMQQYELAKENFSAVLDHEPPPNVKEDIEKLLAKVKTATKRWSTWGRIDAGAFFDDNVNYGPDSDMIDTTLGELQLSSDSTSREAFGLSMTITLNGIYDIGAKGGWSAVGDVATYGTMLDNAHSEELLLMRGSAGLQFVGARTFLQLPVNFQHLDKGHDSYVNTCGLKPALLYALSGNTHLVTTGTAEYRDYTSIDDRDGYFVSLDETVRRYFGKQRHSVSLSLQTFHEHARKDEYTDSGWESALMCELRLPARATAYGRGRFRDSYYEGHSSLEDDDRHDKQLQFMIGVNKVIRNNWGVDLNYVYTDNNSTYDLYDYDRNLVTLSTFVTF